eukprot:TRINITY_DN16459_c0_g1_i2.p2 TRINITY_DN16459_c0_g1~~TRINITY_DN16459_c0_g1_i2.p2  ORF type:complete len:449 (-),score=119.83 TRINITY_DN16459_c0_g1_i2:117-1307(-)
MVGEPYSGGDLTTLRQQARAQHVQTTERWWRDIFSQCFRAVEFMHGQAMMHCDLKEENIMLKTADLRNPRIAVIDFGVAQAIATKADMPCGTPGYIPPETYTHLRWYPNGDVFSLGVVAYQLVTDTLAVKTPQHPRRGLFVDGCSNLGEIAQCTRTRVPPLQLVPRELSRFTPLLRALLEKDVTKRPRAPMVLKDRWFEGAVTSPLRVEDDGDGSPMGKRASYRSCGGMTPSPKSWKTAARRTEGITEDFLKLFEKENEEGGGEKPVVAAFCGRNGEDDVESLWPDLKQQLEEEANLLNGLRAATAFVRDGGTIDGIVCTDGFRVDAALLDRLGGKVRMVSKWGHGTSNIDLDACSKRGISVATTELTPAQMAELCFESLFAGLDGEEIRPVCKAL